MTAEEGARASYGEARGEPRVRVLRGQRLVNVVVRGLLRMPGAAALLGQRLLVLYLTGRKSGRRYVVPVAYLRHRGDLLLGTSARRRHNLRSGELVTIRLRGRLRRAAVWISSAERDVVPAYARMARVNPTFARFNAIGVGADGEPDENDLRLAWSNGATVVRLTPLATKE